MLKKRTHQRAPLGFVVEGHGEYAIYPSFASRIANHSGQWPRVNAHGYGGVIHKLDEHLDDLVKVHHPFAVVVSVDLVDTVKGGYFSNAKELRQHLEEMLREWVKTRFQRPEMSPIPIMYVPVIQVQKLESWLISAPLSLKEMGLISIAPEWGNVDDEELNPSSWIEKNCTPPFDSKSPGDLKGLVSKLDVQEMAGNSRSFSKLVKTVRRAQDIWERTCDAESALVSW